MLTRGRYLASPLTYETFIHYNLRVYPGAQGECHEPQDSIRNVYLVLLHFCL